MLNPSFMEQYETMSQPKKKEETKKVAEQTPATAFDFKPVEVPIRAPSKSSGLTWHLQLCLQRKALIYPSNSFGVFSDNSFLD